MQLVEMWERNAVTTVLLRNWRMSLGLPALNLIFVIIFWQSQLLHYTASTTGVLYMWLVAGLLFLLLQMSLLAGGWRKARHELAGEQRVTSCWNLGVQILLMGIAGVYNSIALVQISFLGVRPTTYFDLIISLVLVVTIVAGLMKYRHRITSPDARLLYATGSKAAPQWLQAGSLAIFGSAGLHISTITAIIVMGGTRFLLSQDALRRFKDTNTSASYKAAFRDFISILAMAAGWLIGRL